MEVSEYSIGQYADECFDNISAGRTVCYIAGVGTGKTFVFMNIAKRLCGDILYVYPKHSVGENILNYDEFNSISNRVKFVTYNHFKQVRDLSCYSLVVIDECHHLCSDLYGINLLQSLTVPAIGLTATPITCGNDCRDLFDVIVYGMSNFEAIESGLMSPYNYHLCIKEVDDEHTRAVTFDTVRTVPDIKSSIPIAKDVIIKSGVNKWIVFFRDTKQIDEYYSEVCKLFTGFTIFIVTSKVRDSHKLLTTANEMERVVLLSCTMLTEGIHLSGFEGIVIFRNIRTVNLFQQVLGRISYIGNSSNITVIDYSECAYKLLFKLLCTFSDKLGDGVSKNKYKRKIIKVSINDIKDISIDSLLELFHKQSKTIYYRGHAYEDIQSLCSKFNIEYVDFIDTKKTYKLSIASTIDLLLSKKGNRIYCDSYL